MQALFSRPHGRKLPFSHQTWCTANAWQSCGFKGKLHSGTQGLLANQCSLHNHIPCPGTFISFFDQPSNPSNSLLILLYISLLSSSALWLYNYLCNSRTCFNTMVQENLSPPRFFWLCINRTVSYCLEHQSIGQQSKCKSTHHKSRYLSYKLSPCPSLCFHEGPHIMLPRNFIGNGRIKILLPPLFQPYDQVFLWIPWIEHGK